MSEPKLKWKDTFRQAAEEGIPSHWAVQYYVDDNPFPEAQYFSIDDIEGVRDFVTNTLGVKDYNFL